jgi:hypothetical protein
MEKWVILKQTVYWNRKQVCTYPELWSNMVKEIIRFDLKM